MQERKISDKLFIPNSRGGKYWSLLMRCFNCNHLLSYLKLSWGSLAREANIHYTVSNVELPKLRSQVSHNGDQNLDSQTRQDFLNPAIL
jgi:hypothetical protein